MGRLIVRLVNDILIDWSTERWADWLIYFLKNPYLDLQVELARGQVNDKGGGKVWTISQIRDKLWENIGSSFAVQWEETRIGHL